MNEQEPPRRGALVAMVVIAVALLGAILMVRRLHEASVIQDCVMAGRTNCAPITTPPR